MSLTYLLKWGENMASDGSITIDTKLDNDGLKSGLSKIGNIAGTALKGVTVAIGTVST